MAPFQKTDQTLISVFVTTELSFSSFQDEQTQLFCNDKDKGIIFYLAQQFNCLVSLLTAPKKISQTEEAPPPKNK